MEKIIICGIYKITAQDGKVYIGQSKDIYKRWLIYKSIPESLKSQAFIYYSLKKYGWYNHIFEIIEECELEDLNCRERYWQDFYDVLGEDGLNVMLVGCDSVKGVLSEKMREKRRGKNSYSFGRCNGESNNAKKVINTQTKKIYSCAFEASKDCVDYKLKTLRVKLSDSKKNNTYFMYLEDYEKYGALNPVVMREDKKAVRDTLTLKKYNSIAEAERDLNIRNGNLRRYLSGERINISYCVFEKDYVEGVVHYPEKLGKRKKVINNLTNEIYENSYEASLKEGIPYSTMRVHLAKNCETKLSHVYSYYNII